MKTVILSSRKKIAGHEGDTYVEIKEGLLNNHTKYLVKLKWIHFASPVDLNGAKSLFLVIDGIYNVDTYSNMDITPFACIDTSDWQATADSTILFEPHEHQRKVMLQQNILRFRFYRAENWLPVGLVEMDHWTAELQFIPIDD